MPYSSCAIRNYKQRKYITCRRHCNKFATFTFIYLNYFVWMREIERKSKMHECRAHSLGFSEHQSVLEILDKIDAVQRMIHCMYFMGVDWLAGWAQKYHTQNTTAKWDQFVFKHQRRRRWQRPRRHFRNGALREWRQTDVYFMQDCCKAYATAMKMKGLYENGIHSIHWQIWNDEWNQRRLFLFSAKWSIFVSRRLHFIFHLSSREILA